MSVLVSSKTLSIILNIITALESFLTPLLACLFACLRIVALPRSSPQLCCPSRVPTQPSAKSVVTPAILRGLPLFDAPAAAPAPRLPACCLACASSGRSSEAHGIVAVCGPLRRVLRLAADSLPIDTAAVARRSMLPRRAIDRRCRCYSSLLLLLRWLACCGRCQRWCPL